MHGSIRCRAPGRELPACVRNGTAAVPHVAPHAGNNDTTRSDVYTPTAVAGNHTFAQLAAQQAGECGLLQDNSVLCWGALGMQRMGWGVHGWSAGVRTVCARCTCGGRASERRGRLVDRPATNCLSLAGTNSYGGNVGANDTSPSYFLAPVTVVGGHHFASIWDSKGNHMVALEVRAAAAARVGGERGEAAVPGISRNLWEEPVGPVR